ncbi:MAG: NUDIX domain-containing protein [bacterium]
MFNIISKTLGVIVKLFYTVTFYKLPQITSVCAIIVNDKGEFLMQERADKQGFCLPGGLTKARESLEKSISREVREETGYEIKNVRYFSYKDVNKKIPYANSIIFTAEISSGELKNSWEGKPVWKDIASIKGKTAFEHDEIIEKYLKTLK